MKVKMIGKVPGNILGMMADCCHKIQHGKITPAELGLFLKRKNPFGKNDVENNISSWKDFYQKQKFSGIDVDSSNIKIPEKQPGFDRLIVVAQGLTLNRCYDKCAENFPCSRYADDLDKVILYNGRDSDKGSYAIWVRDRIEADEELKNLSADQLKKQGVIGITLLERMLYELKYWDETGQHLDVGNWTLCSGSRNSDGSVPRAYWYADKFRLHSNYTNSHNDYLRSRSVIS